MSLVQRIGRAVVTLLASSLITGCLIWTFAILGCPSGGRYAEEIYGTAEDFYGEEDFPRHSLSRDSSWESGWFVLGAALGFIGGIGIIVNTRGRQYI
jgi:hypothetical protein